ncbi:MAG: DUF4388 domain-containing protein [bacterium]
MADKFKFDNFIRYIKNVTVNEFLAKKTEFNLFEDTRIDVTFLGDVYLLIKKYKEERFDDTIKLVFMGDLAHFNIADIFSMLNSLQKTGMLVIKSEDKIKSVYFIKGEIVFASSNQPEDRLGYILYRMGKITKEQWEFAEKKMSSDTRFGSILLKNELITPKNLWWGVKYQIEEIIYSIFGIVSGDFFFIEGAIPEKDLVRFSLNTQRMLMEGYRRLDEWKLITQKFPSDETKVKLSSKMPTVELTQNMQAMINLIKGEMKISEIIRLTQLGRFNTYKILYALLNTGIIEIVGGEKEAKELDSTAVQTINIIKKYNGVFKKLFKLIKDANPKFDHKELFDNFISELSDNLKNLFKDVSLNENGELDEEKLLLNINALKLTGADSLKKVAGLSGLFISQLILEGMNELLNYEIFILRNLLQPEAFELINEEIKKIQYG